MVAQTRPNSWALESTSLVPVRGPLGTASSQDREGMRGRDREDSRSGVGPSSEKNRGSNESSLFHHTPKLHELDKKPSFSTTDRLGDRLA